MPATTPLKLVGIAAEKAAMSAETAPMKPAVLAALFLAVSALLCLVTAPAARADSQLSLGVAKSAATQFAGEVCEGLGKTCDRGYSAKPCKHVTSTEVLCRLNFYGSDGVTCISFVAVYGTNQNHRVDYEDNSAECFGGSGEHQSARAPYLSKKRAYNATKHFARSNLGKTDQVKVNHCKRLGRSAVQCTFEVTLSRGALCRGGKMNVFLKGSPPRLEQDYVGGSIKCQEPALTGGGRFKVGSEVREIRRPKLSTAQVARIATNWFGEVSVSGDDAEGNLLVSYQVGSCQLESTIYIKCSLRYFLNNGSTCTMPVHWGYSKQRRAWRSEYFAEEIVC